MSPKVHRHFALALSIATPYQVAEIRKCIDQNISLIDFVCQSGNQKRLHSFFSPYLEMEMERYW